MKSADNYTNLLEKQDHEETLSKIRQRKKNLTIFFVTLFISLTLIISALIFYLAHDISSEYSINPVQTPNPDNTPDPNHTFILSLQTAAEQLENITSSYIINHYNTHGSINAADPELSAFRSCSNSLRHGSGLIRNALAKIRVDPVLETRSFSEQRVKGMRMIFIAEEDLDSCVGYLGKVESTAVNELRMEVLELLVHLRSRGEFLFYKVTHSLWSDIGDDAITDSLFMICICCLQLMFVSFSFWTICRFG